MGNCYASQGQFAQALPWYERAIAAKEQGDVHGRANAESLGRSFHLVGNCYANLGKLEEAAQWYERACAAQETGVILADSAP